MLCRVVESYRIVFRTMSCCIKKLMSMSSHTFVSTCRLIQFTAEKRRRLCVSHKKSYKSTAVTKHKESLSLRLKSRFSLEHKKVHRRLRGNIVTERSQVPVLKTGWLWKGELQKGQVKSLSRFSTWRNLFARTSKK